MTPQSTCFSLLSQVKATKEAERRPEGLPSWWTLGPHLFRLMIEAFCPALFNTSFHSSSSPRITYLKNKKKYESLFKGRKDSLKQRGW